MYAIVEDSGTQIRVAEGDEFEIDLREGAEAGSEIVFDRVLLISSGEGEPTIGLPYVEGASVKAEVLSNSRLTKSAASSSSGGRDTAEIRVTASRICRSA